MSGLKDKLLSTAGYSGTLVYSLTLVLGSDFIVDAAGADSAFTTVLGMVFFALALFGFYFEFGEQVGEATAKATGGNSP